MISSRCSIQGSKKFSHLVNLTCLLMNCPFQSVLDWSRITGNSDKRFFAVPTCKTVLVCLFTSTDENFAEFMVWEDAMLQQ